LVDRTQCSPALPAGHPFTNVQSSYYWSSSTYAISTYYAWDVGMGSGSVSYSSKDNGYFVWPVRSGQSGLLDASEIRFSDNGHGTVTNNLTGLMWTNDANIKEWE